MKISVADFCPKEALSLPLQPETGEEVGRRVGFSVTGRVVGVRVGFGMRAQALNPGKHLRSKHDLHSGELSLPSLQNWKQF